MSMKGRKTVKKSGRKINIAMAKRKNAAAEKTIDKKAYQQSLRALQIELVKVQRHLIANDIRIAVVIEGRDAAGKDGLIKRIVQHLSPRETRVVALSKPSDRETTQWYFQRFVAHLPAADEFVLFNRSWYNRAGVERVMGFCSKEQYEEFVQAVCPFEELLVKDGILLFKYYLDITREEQKKRLAERREDPLKQWKISPIDATAQAHWKDYSKARNEMFQHTRAGSVPWIIVRANEKRAARLNMIRDLLGRLDYDGKDGSLLKVDRAIVFPFSEDALKSGAIAP